MFSEPCIRGHRSTKCTHADERLMVPVRKPGRPLSTCPHPASRPCFCAGVTAAIPKKQPCRCGPGSKSTKAASIKKEPVDGETSGGEITPPSPARASSSSFKVSKPSTKNSAARLSLDPMGLARMDPSQLHMLSSPGVASVNPLANGIATTMAPMPSYTQAIGVNAMTESFAPQFQQHAHTLQAPFTGPTGPMNGQIAATNGSCCSSKTEPKETSPKQPAVAETKSCCSTKPEPVQQNGTHQTNGTLMPPPPQVAAIPMPNGMYAYYQPPTVFNYPPHYGSYMQPLQPDQWRQVMSTMTYGQPMAQPMYGLSHGVPPSHANGAQDVENWTSHQCSCGDGCQCVGCAAHPYNDATQDYVRSAWASMMGDSQMNGSRHASTNGSETNGHPEQNGEVNGVSTISNGTEMARVPSAPQTPSDATSGLAEEQTLSANDFFFVSYPFSDGCEGDMGSCPCGDDCQCIGCAIHGNVAPEVPATTQA